MIRIGVWLLCGFGLLAVAAVQWADSRDSRSLPPTLPRRPSQDSVLSIPESALNFGTVWAIDDFAWKLPLTNVSPSPVVVSRIATSCNCIVVDESAIDVGLVLDPGQTFEVPLKIDLTQRTDLMASERDFAVSIMVGYDEQSAAKWSLRGQVRDAFDIRFAGTRKLQLVRGSSQPGTIDLQLQARPGMEELQIASSIGEVEVDRISPPDPNRRKVRLHVLPSQMGDSTACELHIAGRTSDGEAVSRRMKVPVGVVDDLAISPDFPHLGLIPVGESRDFEFQIVSRTGRALGELEAEVERSGDGGSLSASISQHVLRLRVTAAAVGEQSFAVALKPFDQSSSNELIDQAVIEFRFTGVQPESRAKEHAFRRRATAIFGAIASLKVAASRGRSLPALLAHTSTTCFDFLGQTNGLAPSESVTIDQIREAWARRCAPVRSLEMEWDSSRTESNVERKDNGPSNMDMFTYPMTTTMKLSGSFLRIARDRHGLPADQTREETKSRKWRYRQSVMASGPEGSQELHRTSLDGSAEHAVSGLISRNPHVYGANEAALRAIFLAYRTDDPDLGWNSDDETRVLPGFGRIGNTDCVRIDDGCTGPVCNELWLDPGRDFLPLRLISRVNGEPSILTEMVFASPSDGFHALESWKFEFVDDEGQLRFAEAATVTGIRWNPPLSDDQFTIIFPDGAHVYDQDQQQDLVAGDGTLAQVGVASRRQGTVHWVLVRSCRTCHAWRRGVCLPECVVRAAQRVIATVASKECCWPASSNEQTAPEAVRNGDLVIARVLKLFPAQIFHAEDE